MSNKVYDFLVWCVVIILPALGTFYASMSNVWGLPYGEQIVATLSALSLLIGAIVKISNSRYKKALSKLADIDKAEDDLK